MLVKLHFACSVLQWKHHLMHKVGGRENRDPKWIDRCRIIYQDTPEKNVFSPGISLGQAFGDQDLPNLVYFLRFSLHREN